MEVAKRQDFEDLQHLIVPGLSSWCGRPESMVMYHNTAFKAKKPRGLHEELDTLQKTPFTVFPPQRNSAPWASPWGSTDATQQSTRQDSP